MSYTNQIIRDITDVANPESKRTLAIADSEKSDVALTTLAITAGELGLATKIQDGVGESGEANRYLLVTTDKDSLTNWANDLALVGDGYPRNSYWRAVLQRKLGKALGYSSKSVNEFVNSEVAATCPCTCCGGDPDAYEV